MPPSTIRLLTSLQDRHRQQLAWWGCDRRGPRPRRAPTTPATLGCTATGPLVARPRRGRCDTVRRPLCHRGSIKVHASREPGALVVASDPECLAAAVAVARASLPCRVIGLMHTWQRVRGVTLEHDLHMTPFTPTDCETYPELACGAWVFHGGMEDAVLCGLEPSNGVMAAMGLDAALCITGFYTRSNFGADSDANPAIAGARKSAIVGVPALAVCSRSPPSSAAVSQMASALARLLPTVVRVLSHHGGQQSHDSSWNNGMSGACNCPRAHFPFPTEGRWAALGSTQLPVDMELKASLWDSTSEYAAHDCWSLGDAISPRTDTGTGEGGESHPAGRRATLRRAFRDGDVFLCTHVSPKWDSAASKPFSSGRPGVLWHQDQVSSPGAASPPSVDLWGRSLPVQRLHDAQPSSEGAVFVPQRNTEKVINSFPSSKPGAQSDVAASRASGPPLTFRIGKGTVLMDASPRGDVDAVMARKTSVSVMQTWPCAHPFSLLDQVMVEALREGSEGLPYWLVEDTDITR